MPDFVVSTFKRLLKVRLTDPGDLQEVRVLAEGHGVYFGLEQRGPLLFVAERNVDIHHKAVSPKDPQNVIRMYLQFPWGKILRLPLCYQSHKFDDLHQIKLDQSGIFLTTAKFPFIIRKSLISRSEIGLDLRESAPEPYIRKDDHNHDAYHFNSIATWDDKLYVMAHNWDLPSFVVQTDLDAARRGAVKNLKVYEDIGSFCHDILPDKKAFWALDSGGGRLVNVDYTTEEKQHFEIAPPSPSPKEVGKMDVPFPRGLSRYQDKLVIGYGFNESRVERMNSEAMLAIFDIDKGRVINRVSLGRHGNTCAVMTLK
jgi:hypothetical protein